MKVLKEGMYEGKGWRNTFSNNTLIGIYAKFKIISKHCH